MVKNKTFTILYLIISLVLISFIFLFIIFSLNIKFPFLNLIFKEKNLPVNSTITYLEGNEIYYTIKGKKKNPILKDTKIQSEMIIETGIDSYICFYIKDQGFYYLYPESSLYVSKIENYNTEKATKESIFNLEKGMIYINVNLFAKSSNLIFETQDVFIVMNKTQTLINKTNDFFTKIYCFDGDIFYRAYSEKFGMFEENKNVVITSSIERLINSSNILKKNETVQLDGSNQKRLDNLLNKIYESQNTKLINKNYITQYLKIQTSQINEIEKNNFNLPNFDLSKFSITNKAQLELFIPSDNSITKFENKYIKNNTRYLFFLDSGKYLLNQTFNFSTIENTILIKENEYKKIVTKIYTGMTDILLNNAKTIFEQNNFTIQTYNGKIDENLFLISLKNNLEIKSVTLNFDLDIKNLYLLNDKVLDYDFLVNTGLSTYVKNKFYKIYKVKLNNKKNIQIQFGKPLTDKDLNFIIEYEKKYSF